MWWVWKNLPIEEQFDKTGKSKYNVWINNKLTWLAMNCSNWSALVLTWHNCPHLSSHDIIVLSRYNCPNLINVLSWHHCPHDFVFLISPDQFWFDHLLLSWLVLTHPNVTWWHDLSWSFLTWRDLSSQDPSCLVNNHTHFVAHLAS